MGVEAGSGKLIGPTRDRIGEVQVSDSRFVTHLSHWRFIIRCLSRWDSSRSATTNGDPRSRIAYSVLAEATDTRVSFQTSFSQAPFTILLPAAIHNALS